MFSHIMIGANDIEESKTFYDNVLGVLGCEPGVLSVNPTGHNRYMYFLDGSSIGPVDLAVDGCIVGPKRLVMLGASVYPSTV